MTCPTNSSALALVAALALAGSAFAQETGAADQGIEVEQLQALDPFEVGLPGAALSGDAWAASDAEMVEIVLRHLPGANGGPEGGRLESLTAAILAGGGEPPAGARGDHDLAALRANRLLAAGGADIVHDLLSRTPGVENHAGLARLHAETGFARGEIASACRTARSLTENRDAAYWLRARALCALVEGQGAQAEINADLARAAEPDENFDSLLFTLALEGEVEPSARAVDGMTYAMFEMAGAAPQLADDAPGWLRRREARARRAAIAPSADPIADLIAADSLDNTEGERAAMLVSVIAQGRDRVAAAQALGALLADARQSGDFVSTARRHGGEVGTLPVTIDTIDHGVDFVFAALIAGDARAATRWRNALIDGPPPPLPPVTTLAPGQAPGESADAGSFAPATLTPAISEPVQRPEWSPPSPRLMVAIDLALAVSRDRMRGDGVSALVEAWHESRGPESLPELAAIDALGGEAPARLRAGLFTSASQGADGALAAMDAALRDGARAEAALIAVHVLNDWENGDIQGADSYARAIAALSGAGARDAALALIVERIAASVR